ncbi:hypothetical protein ACUY3M_10080 [Corynebacterium suicordis]
MCEGHELVVVDLADVPTATAVVHVAYRLFLIRAPRLPGDVIDLRLVFRHHVIERFNAGELDSENHLGDLKVLLQTSGGEP